MPSATSASRLRCVLGLVGVRVEAVEHHVEDAGAEALLDELGDQLQLLRQGVGAVGPAVGAEAVGLAGVACP